MTSGVTVMDECIDAFNEIKMGHQWQFIIYRLSDDLKSIVVEEKGPRRTSYDTFVERLREAEAKKQCRYAVFDVNYVQNDMEKKKLVFFAWSPDSAAIKQKMIYASSLKALKNKLRGIQVEVQCNDAEDLRHEEVIEKCKDKYQ
ncbi:hypothetical protein CHS0354_008563 [Potamilus streckersoni]|uniref:ADF-H domain-containing protein n=1 Tax=Potamilus streckersoni TaxID=2493646 RepID=A0AAE0RSG9_9BIVA|nr:hypothetical protein CHS0354_008563 [Potamilus streckersoni]